MKNALIIGMLLLFVGASVASGFQITSSTTLQPLRRGWLYVGGSGPGNYTTIQSAINDANPGDTVFVYSGIYYENVVVNKTIDLIGAERDTTIIDGGGIGRVIDVLSNLVSINGFTIQHSISPSGSDAAVLISHSNSVTISNNIITDNSGIGVFLVSSASCTIEYNTIKNHTDCGIDIGFVGSENNLVSHNDIFNNTWQGIRTWYSDNDIITNNSLKDNYQGLNLEYSSDTKIIDNTINNNQVEGISLKHSSHNTIAKNTVSNNHEGLLLESSHNNIITDNFANLNYNSGIYLKSSTNNNVTNNIVSNNNAGIILESFSNETIITGNNANSNVAGILLASSSNNNVMSNNASNNDYGIALFSLSNNTVAGNNANSNKEVGILLSSSNNNIIKGNNASNNDNYGIYLYSSSNNNHLYHNNIINNTQNAYDEDSNIWDNGYPCGGNYWSDYTGIDSDGDGIGDTPYNIPGGSNQDRYPLMHPFEQYYILNISLDNHEVNESTPFYVTVKTLAGTRVPYAQVLFNDEIITTDPNGIAAFYSPEVTEDVVFPILASKSGYTSDTDTILVKNVPEELTWSFIFGTYRNLTEQGRYVTIEGVNLWLVLFNPFEIRHLIIQYGGPEKVTYLRDTAKVILLPQFILGFVEVAS